MKRKSFDEMECGIARALDLIGDPWTVLIIREAMFGTDSFDAFHKRLGIPRNTLTDRLNQLVASEILSRTRDPVDGRKSTYDLQERGRELITVLVALSQWGNKWAFADTGPPSFVADRATGTPVRTVEIVGKDGKPLDADDLTMLPGPSASDRLRAFFKTLR